MRAAVVYEPTDANTTAIAEAIGRGLGSAAIDVTVASFDAFAPASVIDLDLLAVGAPTHGRGLGHDEPDATDEQEQKVFDGTAPEPSIREWLEDLPDGAGRAAMAFDTRRHGPAVLTGAAGKSIESKLESAGFQMAAAHESFLLGKDDALESGEETRAEAWAAETGALLESLLEER